MTSTAKTTASIVPPLPRRTSSSLGDHQLPRPSSNASSSVSGPPRAADSRSGDDDAPDEITAMISRDRMQRSYNTAPAVASTTTDTVSGLRSPPASLGGRKRKAGRTRRFSTASAPPTSRTDIGASPGRWRRFKEKYGSIELDNKGSVARDHLSLERTFLAWLRTSLSFASIGIAVTQLFRLNSTLQSSPSSTTPNSGSSGSSAQIRLRQVGKPLGATFLAVGIVTLLLGFHRYFESQHYVIRGKFPASRGSVVLVSVIAGALVITSFVVIVTIAPTAFNT